MGMHAGLTLQWYDDTKLTGFASDVKDTTVDCPCRMHDFPANGYFAPPVPQRASDTDSLKRTGYIDKTKRREIVCPAGIARFAKNNLGEAFF
jgi:hypothetical protein